LSHWCRLDRRRHSGLWRSRHLRLRRGGLRRWSYRRRRYRRWSDRLRRRSDRRYRRDHHRRNWSSRGFALPGLSGRFFLFCFLLLLLGRLCSPWRLAPGRPHLRGERSHLFLVARGTPQDLAGLLDALRADGVAAFKAFPDRRLARMSCTVHLDSLPVRTRANRDLLLLLMTASPTLLYRQKLYPRCRHRRREPVSPRPRPCSAGPRVTAAGERCEASASRAPRPLPSIAGP
jgi:hypothetical protein